MICHNMLTSFMTINIWVELNIALFSSYCSIEFNLTANTSYEGQGVPISNISVSLDHSRVQLSVYTRCLTWVTCNLAFVLYKVRPHIYFNK